jgi:predicted DCC family thiol-disulfide oxidoreductase YuxK
MEFSTEAERENLTSERYPLLLFFDGECAFCDRWVNRVKAADQGQRLRYGTKQGETFRQVARIRPHLAKIESIVLVKRRADGGEDFFIRSAATREIIRGLPEFRSFALILRAVPAPLSDLGYRIFSKLRKPLFGQLSHCRVPLEQEMELFVE